MPKKADVRGYRTLILLLLLVIATFVGAAVFLFSHTSSLPSDTTFWTGKMESAEIKDEIQDIEPSLHFKNGSLGSEFIKFPIDNIIELIETETNQSEKELDEHIADLIKLLVPFVSQAPAVPVNDTCHAPPFQEEDIRCSDYPDIFEPEPAQNEQKMAIALQFGYDYFNEFDHIFLLESMVSQHHKIEKPLIWELERQAMKRDTSIFGHEDHQERSRWEAVKKWNAQTNYYGDEDLIAFGDVDEIPSLRNIRLLKNCVLKKSPVDIGIWFTMGRLSQAFESDYPVPDHPYSLGDPTFFKFKDAKEYELVENSYPGRLRGGSGRFLLGGAHLTNYGISCSECGLDKDLLIRWEKGFKEFNVAQLED
ncbi:hypothetical protein BDR26DRAFT_852779 [Obelidium mucronatum]|nr:hypothetical protein BDR26DRAFT_852779 [Obelidium mucronatum]